MLAKSIAAALLAALAAAQDPHSKSVECTVVYTTAYMSTLNGVCSQMACTPSCQQQIDAVRSACAEAKYNETDPITGIIAERSFMQKSIQALQLMAPIDCDYRIGYENCDSAGLCSMQGTNSVEEHQLHGARAAQVCLGRSHIGELAADRGRVALVRGRVPRRVRAACPRMQRLHRWTAMGQPRRGSGLRQLPGGRRAEIRGLRHRWRRPQLPRA